MNERNFVACETFRHAFGKQHFRKCCRNDLRSLKVTKNKRNEGRLRISGFNFLPLKCFQCLFVPSFSLNVHCNSLPACACWEVWSRNNSLPRFSFPQLSHGTIGGISDGVNSSPQKTIIRASVWGKNNELKMRFFHTQALFSTKIQNEHAREGRKREHKTNGERAAQRRWKKVLSSTNIKHPFVRFLFQNEKCVVLTCRGFFILAHITRRNACGKSAKLLLELHRSKEDGWKRIWRSGNSCVLNVNPQKSCRRALFENCFSQLIRQSKPLS